MNLGLSVKIALCKSNMTAIDLAKTVGVGEAQISLISNNRRNTNTATLVKIAGAFGMSVSEFVALGEEDK